MNVSVIGLGHAGLPLAAVIADSGLKVIGVDLDKANCKQINNGINPISEEPELGDLIKKHGGKNLIATSDYIDAKNSNLFIVIVPLFIDDDHNPDFKFLENAFRNIGKILKKEDCIVLETTVPPMFTETLVKQWLEEESGMHLGDFYLAYSPERIMTGFSISRLKEFPKVIGGVDKESGDKAYSMYNKFISNLILVSSSKVAEFIKIIEGCYRFSNIALANELYKISEEFGIDFYEARKYANHQFCDIHIPSTGVGGHCIPVYPWFLIKKMENFEKNDNTKLLRTSYEVNKTMINFWADKIVTESMKIEKPLNNVKICVKGITYRTNVKSTHYSRNLALVNLLVKKGLDLYVYDKMFSKEEIEEMNFKFLNPKDADIVFDPFKLEITR